jgi:hypothetical protein
MSEFLQVPESLTARVAAQDKNEQAGSSWMDLPAYSSPSPQVYFSRTIDFVSTKLPATI